MALTIELLDISPILLPWHPQTAFGWFGKLRQRHNHNTHYQRDSSPHNCTRQPMHHDNHGPKQWRQQRCTTRHHLLDATNALEMLTGHDLGQCGLKRRHIHRRHHGPPYYHDINQAGSQRITPLPEHNQRQQCQYFGAKHYPAPRHTITQHTS